MYDSHRDPPSYDKLTSLIKDLPSESDFNSALNGLILCRDKTLSKPVGSGSNDFQFEFSHYLIALKGELTLLNENLAGLEDEQVVEKLKADKAFLANNENRVRNVLAIFIDLINHDKANKNFGEVKVSKHASVKDFNIEFYKLYSNMAVIFRKLKKYRNALCHLDPNTKEPYKSEEDLSQLIRKIDSFNKLDYVSKLSERLEVPQLSQTATTVSINRADNMSTLSKKRSNVGLEIASKEDKRLKVSTKQPNQSLVDYSDSDSDDDEDKHSEEDTDTLSLRRGP